MEVESVLELVVLAVEDRAVQVAMVLELVVEEAVMAQEEMAALVVEMAALVVEMADRVAEMADRAVAEVKAAEEAQAVAAWVAEAHSVVERAELPAGLANRKKRYLGAPTSLQH